MKVLIWLVLIGMVRFGSGEKGCPVHKPIPQGERFEVTCNTTFNPTGDLGDPPCYYPECAEKGRSSVCGCVDFRNFGGSGQWWSCIHSQCKCPSDETLEDDPCGIHGADFLNPTFIGDAPVAGTGCTLDSRAGCLCKPVLGNDIPIEAWTWQCTKDACADTIVSSGSSRLSGFWRQ